MKTKLLITIIGLLSFSLCSSYTLAAGHQYIATSRPAKVEMEKQMIVKKLDSINANNQKLSDEERSRGNALLSAFANEHLPLFAEKYKAMRTKCLEAEANFNELLAALKADGLDPNKDETAQALSENLRNLHASYWTIRYKINDFYSQFKIGVITSEELSKVDEQLAPVY